MTEALIVVLAIVVPVILFPAAYVWYLNLGGILEAMKETPKAGIRTTAKAKAK